MTTKDGGPPGERPMSAKTCEISYSRERKAASAVRCGEPAVAVLVLRPGSRYEARVLVCEHHAQGTPPESRLESVDGSLRGAQALAWRIDAATHGWHSDRDLMRLLKEVSGFLAGYVSGLEEALEPFAKFACDEPHVDEPECHNCRAARVLLSARMWARGGS